MIKSQPLKLKAQGPQAVAATPRVIPDVRLPWERIRQIDAELRFNGAVTEEGPHLIVVGSDAEVDVIWRDLQGVWLQHVDGPVRFEDTNDDEVLELVQTVEGRDRVWFWVGKGFTHLWRGRRAPQP